MCLIVIAYKCCPGHDLVVAANRDEFRARPACPAHWWPEQPGLLAGRDLEAGGTWLGMTRGGRFAALTNFRDPTRHRPGTPSRGALVRDCLLDTADTLDTLHALARRSAGYSGFNLFVYDGHTLGIHESITGAVRALQPGVYALSNHLLDTDWPKVARARAGFERALRHVDDTPASFQSRMLEVLRDGRAAPDHALPETGVSLEWERRLSPVFIDTPEYGTRCSTLITLRSDGWVRFAEWTWDDTHPAASQDRDTAKRGGLAAPVLHEFRATTRP